MNALSEERGPEDPLSERGANPPEGAVAFYVDGRRVGVTQHTLAYIAGYAGVRRRGVVEIPRISVKQLRALLSDAGITDPLETEWSFTLPNTGRIVSTRYIPGRRLPDGRMITPDGEVASIPETRGTDGSHTIRTQSAEVPHGRNPPWARDELILAMDIYLKYRPSAPDQSNPDVIELSEILNSLPIHTVRPDIEKFRNPNGVSMKLANFQALDPEYQGVGLSRGAKADAQIWDYFIERRDELARLAVSLRQAAASGNAPVGEEEGEDEVEEGKIVFRTHRARERNPQLRKRKIEAVVREKGELACLVCGFNFATTYGEELGGGFIEVHHVTPLSELGGVTKTRLKDLAVVCSNCHRMLHRAKPWLQPQELQGRLNQ